MMDLGISRGVFSPFCAPPNQFIYELLSRGLLLGESPQQAQKLPLAPRIWLRLALVKYLEKEYTQVAARTALPGLQE